MIRRAVGWLAALMLAMGQPVLAEGPSPAPPSPWRLSVIPDQWRRDVPPSPALDVPIPVSRDEETQRVTLKEAIAIALENNPGIAARRLEPTRIEQNVLEAQSQYDPVAAGGLLYESDTTPNPNSLADTIESRVKQRTLTVGVDKLLRSSTRLGVDFSQFRLDNNARFFTLRPQYQPELILSVSQPLLRDFGWDFTYLVVNVAERTADAALYTFEAELADFVQQVIVAYYAVAGARAQVDVRREAMDLANRTTAENRARVDVGLAAPVAVLEAEADAKLREEELIRAENVLEVSRQRLAQLCFYRPASTFVPRTLEPVEYEPPSQVQPDVEETLNAALVHRPEILASSQGVEARQLQERIAQNRLLPRLDLVGSYGVNNLSGRGQTFISERDVGNCTFISEDVYQCRQTAFVGSERKAYNRFFAGEFESYSFGVQLEVPLDNAAAKSQHTRTRIEVNQAELNHRQLLSDVTLEARQAVADVLSGWKRIDASRVATDLAAENLRNQQKRYEVGMATTKDLLDFQQRLTSARAAQVQAHLDYAISVARWHRAQGNLLGEYEIVLQRPGKRSPPWFAWF